MVGYTMAVWQGVALWKAATLYQDICLKNYILFEAKVQIYSLDSGHYDWTQVGWISVQA